ncbi:MAG TPA: Asp-tRNA(Asn)/Glu-tRNA(Gln) amidotransferase subunit GatC [Rhodothermales bacterium]|nr:Asp-tRNA(Asn)/Glu-tRNA(Gln) amidotransferase GatCAB subunit C [Bacteroidota bacterium]HRK73754.1 Asp-tRNA(Asn)/Glu-tRNA(Gln) amidotransferase subunit GatC [Rhodothermales bacterium]HRR09843.1 Asp-tRNA(Asn)/Glu-tRNA(Gln) amidotransferase subunit GatC [Rhodothermales bacterium]
MVTQKDVQEMASLARLRLTEQEVQHYQHDLNRILAYMDQLNEVDTTGIEPMTHLQDWGNVLREDVYLNRITHEDALKNAPDADADYFRVPKVIE